MGLRGCARDLTIHEIGKYAMLTVQFVAIPLGLLAFLLLNALGF